jgi:hypothetical protein
MTLFTQQDGPRLVENGNKMAKKRNPVYLQRQTEPFSVETTEGTLTAKAGDYVAHDPISGHVWPVAADYVRMHYEDF